MGTPKHLSHLNKLGANGCGGFGCNFANFSESGLGLMELLGVAGFPMFLWGVPFCQAHFPKCCPPHVGWWATKGGVGTIDPAAEGMQIFKSKV